MSSRHVSALIGAASGNSERSLEALQKLITLLRHDQSVLSQVLPLFISHLSFAKLEDAEQLPETQDRLRFTNLAIDHARMCLAILTWTPGDRLNEPLPVFRDPQCAQVVYGASTDILRWISYILRRCVQLSDDDDVIRLAIGPALCSLTLLREDLYYASETLEITLFAWLMEAHDTRFYKLLRAHQAYMASEMSHMLQEVLIPGPDMQHLLAMQPMFLGPFAYEVVHAAFRHANLLELSLRPHLPLIDSTLSVILDLLKLGSIQDSAFVHSALFAPENVAAISRIFSFMACNGKMFRLPLNSNRATVLEMTSKIIQRGTVFLIMAFLHRRDVRVVISAVDNGLVPAVLRGAYWLSNAFESYLPTQKVIRSKDDCLALFGEHFVFAHLWSYPLFLAVAEAVDEMRRTNTLGTSQLARDLDWLVSRWRPIADEVAARTDLELSRCGYSKCQVSRNAAASLKICIGCRDAKFCSSACQAAAWKSSGDNHRAICVPRRRRMIDNAVLTSRREIAFAQAVFAYELQSCDHATALKEMVSHDRNKILCLRMDRPLVCGFMLAPVSPAREVNRELWGDMMEPQHGELTVIIAVPETQYTSESFVYLAVPAS